MTKNILDKDIVFNGANDLVRFIEKYQKHPVLIYVIASDSTDGTMVANGLAELHCDAAIGLMTRNNNNAQVFIASEMNPNDLKEMKVLVFNNKGKRIVSPSDIVDYLRSVEKDREDMNLQFNDDCLENTYVNFIKPIAASCLIM
ncbi:hypothetical protein GGF41_008337 [Coemansia sp. RSA 2531]|nr:hypothetical protein GGF41_008337 [Coemansia sp. RSA 2531]